MQMAVMRVRSFVSRVAAISAPERARLLPLRQSTSHRVDKRGANTRASEGVRGTGSPNGLERLSHHGDRARSPPGLCRRVTRHFNLLEGEGTGEGAASGREGPATSSDVGSGPLRAELDASSARVRHNRFLREICGYMSNVGQIFVFYAQQISPVRRSNSGRSARRGSESATGGCEPLYWPSSVADETRQEKTRP